MACCVDVVSWWSGGKKDWQDGWKCVIMHAKGWLGKARRVSWIRERDEGLRDHRSRNHTSSSGNITLRMC
jgi:hypothetical protein